MVIGNPARHIGYVNQDGIRLDSDGNPVEDDPEFNGSTWLPGAGKI